MSLYHKFKELLFPVADTSNAIPVFAEEHQIQHEFLTFAKAYRIGILCYYTDPETQTIIGNYKNRLEQLGYECELLMYFDKKERDPNVYLPTFDINDLDKKTGIPNSPRTDRFMLKKYDLMMNLYTEPVPQLLHLAKLSQARCRIGAYIDVLREVSDLMVLCEDGFEMEKIITNINKSLNLKPYERKQI